MASSHTKPYYFTPNYTSQLIIMSHCTKAVFCLLRCIQCLTRSSHEFRCIFGSRTNSLLSSIGYCPDSLIALVVTIIICFFILLAVTLFVKDREENEKTNHLKNLNTAAEEISSNGGRHIVISEFVMIISSASGVNNNTGKLRQLCLGQESFPRARYLQ